MVNDLPAALTVDILAITASHLVGDDGKMATGLVAQELLEQRSNDRAHTRGQNDNGDIVLLGPVVELLEVWVQLHVLQQNFDALVVGGLDACEHLAEGITEPVQSEYIRPVDVNRSHRKLRVSSRTCLFKTRRRSAPKPRLSIYHI